MKNILNKLTSKERMPSVSMMVPSDLKSFSDKETLIIKLKENVIDAEAKLLKVFGQDAAIQLGDKLKKLVGSVDINTLSKGLGFYVSANVSEKVDLPFAPVERTSIADSFDTSDIEEGLKLLSGYEVLVLSRKESRLFTGTGDKLSPISDDVFPAVFEDEFQVKRPGQHSLYNSEESKINQARRDSYFRKIDKALSHRDNKTPLVLVGTVENLSDFKKIRKSTQKVAGEILGNMDHTPINKIGKKIWNEVSEYMNERAMADYQSDLLKVIDNVL